MLNLFSPAGVSQWFSTRPRLADIMKPEDNSFGVLRLAMASAVLISHSYMYAFGTSEAEPLTALTGHSLGEHAVQVFFILSGILVAQSFARSRSMVDFVGARILRIFPALIVCVLATAFILGPMMTSLSLGAYFSNSELPKYLAKTLSLSTGNAPLPGLFADLPMSGRVNTSLWTLKYEVLCYAALALVGTAGLFKEKYRGVPAGFLAAFLVFVFAWAPENKEQYAFTDSLRYFLLYFGMGTLVYLVREQLRITAWGLSPLFALFVMCLGSRFGELATALFLAYGVAVFANMKFGPFRAFTNRFDLSFGVYIYAGPIQQALLDVAPNLNPLLIAAVAASIVVPLAFLSWVVIEHPALQLRGLLRDRVFLIRSAKAAGR